MAPYPYRSGWPSGPRSSRVLRFFRSRPLWSRLFRSFGGSTVLRPGHRSNGCEQLHDISSRRENDDVTIIGAVGRSCSGRKRNARSATPSAAAVESLCATSRGRVEPLRIPRWWPERPPHRLVPEHRRARRRPRLRRPRLLRLGDRPEPRPPRRACGSPTSTRRRCARRPGRRCSPGSSRTGPGSATSPTPTPASPATPWSSPDAPTRAEILPRRRASQTLMVGKWHLAKDSDCTAAGAEALVAVPAGLRPLLRLPRRLHQPAPPAPARRGQPPRSRSTSTPTATTSPTTSPTGPSR